MHISTLIGYALVAVLSSIVTYFIAGKLRREELDLAYSNGFDEARDSTILPAVQDDDITYSTRSFTARIPDLSAGDYELDGVFDHLYKSPSSYEPETRAVPVHSYAASAQDYTTSSVPSAYSRPEYTPTDLEIRNQVDDLCRDMDRECEIYMAQLATQNAKWQATNSYSLYRGYGYDPDGTGPVPVIAREVQITTREVVFQ